MRFAVVVLTCFTTLGYVIAQDEDFDEFDEFDQEIQEQVDATDVPDPIEPVNRGIWWLNDKLYFYVVKPVAVGYKTITPEPLRKSVNNFFNNLGFPKRLVNNLLQLKFRGAGEELRNFTFNTTAGCLGLFDVAEDHYGWEYRDEDFGQTMAYYGADQWMAVHLPVLGPSNLRDSLGMIPDLFLDPVILVDTWGASIAIYSGKKVNKTSLYLGLYENIKKENLDVYRFLQDAYEQNRAMKIKE